MRIVILLFLIPIGLLLQACGGLNPITLARLSQMSPLTADPAAIQVMIDFPDGIRIPRGSAVLGFEAELRSTGETIAGNFVLAETGAARRLYRIDPADIPEMRAFQARAKAWEATHPDDSSGSMSIDLQFCKIGEGPAPDATVDVSIRMETDGPFLPLIRNGAIYDAEGAEEIVNLPQCENENP